jgi:acetyl-CoA carboxylase carboxyl transferase subunit beta
MNWIKNFVKPKLRSLLNTVQKRDVPENLWIKDPDSGDMVYKKDLEANHYVFPKSNHHARMPVAARFAHMFDASFEKIEMPKVVADPLKFRDEKKYADRLRDAQAKNNGEDSVQAATGKVEGLDMVICVQDMSFIGGSLGMAAGDAIITAMRQAATRKLPFVMFVASGGARMQEGILSLMQLPRTTIAVQEMREVGIPYIVVLTNPTTGGVTASYAMLGDIHIAEPQALIGFAGQRVIEQTIREKLPEGFQRAEYLRDHGMVDMVVSRLEMKHTIARIARLLTKTVDKRASRTQIPITAPVTAPVTAPATTVVPAA